MKIELLIQFQDTFIIKPPKKSPLLLRMVVLLFAMICGIYICSICLKQIGSRSSGPLATVHVVERPCETTNVDPSEKPYIHFPKPKTFSRWDIDNLFVCFSISLWIKLLTKPRCIRAECACNPVRFFAILSTQRSGSGWFETLLNSHMNISSNGEIFSVKVRKINASTILETLDKLYDLDFLTSASKNECTTAVGLKWMLNQVSAIFKILFVMSVSKHVVREHNYVVRVAVICWKPFVISIRFINIVRQSCNDINNLSCWGCFLIFLMWNWHVMVNVHIFFSHPNSLFSLRFYFGRDKKIWLRNLKMGRLLVEFHNVLFTTGLC